MKAKPIILTTMAGMLLVAAGALASADAAPATDVRIGADPGMEIRVVPVDEVGRVSPRVVRRPRYGDAPRVTMWTSAGTGGLVHPGQDLTVRFSVDRDAYVAVYDIDTRGVVRLLYPDRPGDDGFVRGGRTRRLPGPHAGYRLMVTGPPGVERIVALASDRPLVHRWRAFAEEDLAGICGPDGGYRVAGGELGLRFGDEDAAVTAVIRAGIGGEVAPRLARRPVDPRPGPRYEAAVFRDETWFRVGRRWRW